MKERLFFLITLVICVVLLAGASALVVSGLKPKQPDASTKANHEDITFALVMNSYVNSYQRLVIACAYETARKGGTREQAEKNCSIKWPEGIVR